MIKGKKIIRRCRQTYVLKILAKLKSE